jgi:hypothetical protein
MPAKVYVPIRQLQKCHNLMISSSPIDDIGAGRETGIANDLS